PPPPPPAIRGIISGALLAVLTLTAAPPAEAQTVRTYTFTATNDAGDRDPVAPGLQVDEGDTVTLTLTVSGVTSGEAGWSSTPFSGTATAGDDYQVGIGSGHGAFRASAVVAGDRDLFQAVTYSITNDTMPEPDETIIAPVPVVTGSLNPDTYTTTSTDITITIRQNDGYVDPNAPVADNPAARAARLEAPAAALARSVGQLAVDAITQRVDGAGRLGLWGSGGYVSAEGEHDGVDYDGDTSAFHLGMDTTWRDGLIGIAAANSAGDLDFTANGMTSTLETNVTSIHPYLARRLNNAQLWTTVGYGSGEAELKEPGGANITTDLTVLTAAFNIAHAPGDMLSAQVGALYSRAALDEVAGPPGLSKVTVHTMRINAAGEVGWRHDNWRPFLTVNLRHDAGDGDVGSAGDLGGGVEWQTPTAILRLSGATHFAGDGAEEDRLTFTARQNAGRLNLGINLGVANGMDTANLLSGEWRF
ncbi:MAG: autotransporter outer membrane beta-barrel domain-containing protein, partial [Gammaproteobacteria bacterium]|nr:autotransporter outer membrane beta-barrel domain-containing protein [Gammaproteobacteria bacterium]